MAKHTMLDLVPLTRPRRKVAYTDPQTSRISEPLQAHLPQATPGAVAAPAVGREQQFRCLGVGPRPHLLPPTPNRLRRERRRIVIDPNAYPTLITSQIIDPIRNPLAQTLIHKVLGTDLLRFPGRLPLTAPVLEIPD